MYWMLLPGAVPGPVEFGIGDLPALVALLTACIPGGLAARHAWHRGPAERESRQLPAARGLTAPTRRAA